MLRSVDGERQLVTFTVNHGGIALTLSMIGFSRTGTTQNTNPISFTFPIDVYSKKEKIQTGMMKEWTMNTL